MTENEFRTIVRTNIRRYRDYRKWTQAEFAEKLNISVNFLSDVENGKRWISPASMVKFASVLHIEPYELFKPAEKQPPTVSTLLNKYNDEVIFAVSKSIKQVHNYYQMIVNPEIIKKVSSKKAHKNKLKH
jgi:transcriptional regulator with XRE-family HTH domain